MVTEIMPITKPVISVHGRKPRISIKGREMSRKAPKISDAYHDKGFEQSLKFEPSRGLEIDLLV